MSESKPIQVDVIQRSENEEGVSEVITVGQLPMKVISIDPNGEIMPWKLDMTAIKAKCELLDVIKTLGVVSEKRLTLLVWKKNISETDFDSGLEMLIKEGKIRREFLGPKCEKGIWYYIAS